MKSDFACRLCGSHGFDLLESEGDWLARAASSSDERAAIATLVRDDADLSFDAIVRCEACGLASVQTPPSPEALGRFYSRYYASHMYGTKRDKKIKRAVKRVRRLKRKTSGRRFLDVGSNLGFAVEGAHREGLEAMGIEIDSAAVAEAQTAFPHNRYEATTVEAFAKTGQQFDIVYCSEVIEHAIDFKSFANALLDLVAPGGLLYLTTPADRHRRTPKPLVSWVQVKPPEHLTWFAREHLERLFERPGYSVRFQFNPKPGHKITVKRDG